MKIRLIRITALALALMLCAAALADVLTTGNVWMRSEPNREGSKITSFPEGTWLIYLGETCLDERPVAWYKVTDGQHTGWVSSMYSELIGEESIVVDDSGDGEPISDWDSGDDGINHKESSGGSDGGTFSWTSESSAVEVSGYYHADLLAAAYGLSLPSFRNEEYSEVPYQYYDDAITIAGYSLVECISISGKGYAVYGVSVGTSVSDAVHLLTLAGLDMMTDDAEYGITFEHRSSDDYGYTDEYGHDSCIDLAVSGGVVVGIDWSSYTG